MHIYIYVHVIYHVTLTHSIMSRYKWSRIMYIYIYTHICVYICIYLFIYTCCIMEPSHTPLYHVTSDRGTYIYINIHIYIYIYIYVYVLHHVNLTHSIMSRYKWSRNTHNLQPRAIWPIGITNSQELIIYNPHELYYVTLQQIAEHA